MQVSLILLRAVDSCLVWNSTRTLSSQSARVVPAVETCVRQSQDDVSKAASLTAGSKHKAGLEMAVLESKHPCRGSERAFNPYDLEHVHPKERQAMCAPHQNMLVSMFGKCRVSYHAPAPTIIRPF